MILTTKSFQYVCECEGKSRIIGQDLLQLYEVNLVVQTLIFSTPMIKIENYIRLNKSLGENVYSTQQVTA